MRKFNVAGNCIPNMHYMVDISEKIDQIFLLVEDCSYFTINRGRQYGKTTTIGMLEKRLPDDYICASISFQYSEDEMFADEKGFCKGLLRRIYRALSLENTDEANLWLNENITDFAKLDLFLTERNRDKKVVLIIDESDEASNNNLFVRFLKMLRDKYLFRNAGKDYTFHSVILAGVYDIRNLKQKMILQGNYTPSLGESAMNSPWNIAVDFKIDMSFSAKEIETMLVDYEKDHGTGMNISEIANEIRFYTSGYPYLVSRICQFIETDLDKNWTIEGVQEAIKLILKEKSTLFDDMIKKIEENQALSDLIFDLTVGKIKYEYNVDDPVINFGLMFGFIAEEKNGLQMHNKIFEIRITNYFVSKTKRNWREQEIAQTPFNEIVKDGFFDMELCLTKFKQHYSEIYTEKHLKFLERDGKLIFLTYLKPLINGYGFYHFEPETRDYGRMDLVVDFLKQQFIIELKLWYGSSKHEDAYDQLANYLKSKNMECGYLLTYDFRKKRDPLLHETQWVNWKGKRIFDVILRVGEEDSD
ncbi:MAG: ATP-binding protein [Marinilabiliaceae bacterium]|nr:ATP-binding protein [Marinilabiliaceae bacterium]